MVEAAVRDDCEGTTPAYKTKIRSLVINLKEKSNASLRDSVANGDIPAGKFARMSSQVRLL
jgi:transcription elongation factor S-II